MVGEVVCFSLFSEVFSQPMTFVWAEQGKQSRKNQWLPAYNAANILMSLQLKLDCEVQHGMFIFSTPFSKCFKRDRKQSSFFQIMLLAMGELQWEGEQTDVSLKMCFPPMV